MDLLAVAPCDRQTLLSGFGFNKCDGSFVQGYLVFIRNSGRLGRYSRTMLSALWQSQGGGQLQPAAPCDRPNLFSGFSSNKCDGSFVQGYLVFIRNSGRLGPYSRTMLSALWQSQGGGQLQPAAPCDRSPLLAPRRDIGYEPIHQPQLTVQEAREETRSRLPSKRCITFVMPHPGFRFQAAPCDRQTLVDRSTSRIRNCLALGPYSWTMPGAL